MRRALAELLADGSLKVPDIPDVPVTVSEVKLSPDLRKATVYVLPLGGAQTDEVVQALNRERREIRRILNRRVQLKHSPELRFVDDPMFDRLDHMRRLFNQEAVRRDIAPPNPAQEE